MDYPTFDPRSPETPLTEDELSALDRLLDELPADGAMTLDGLDGYLTALVVGPPLLQSLATAYWLPAIWGGDTAPGTPAPFPSNQKKKRTTVLVLRHLRSVLGAFQRNPQAWEPIFNVAELPDDAGSELADAGDWCRGFLAAIDLDPAAWAGLRDAPDTGPGLAAIAVLGDDDSGLARGIAPDAATEDEPAIEDEDLDDPVLRDRLSRAVVDGVIALWGRKAESAN